jgi:hypothetical protein
MPFSSLVVHLKGFLPIIVPKPARWQQPINYIPYANIELVEHVPDVLIEWIFVLLIQIIIPHDTFK